MLFLDCFLEIIQRRTHKKLKKFSLAFFEKNCYNLNVVDLPRECFSAALTAVEAKKPFVARTSFCITGMTVLPNMSCQKEVFS